MRKPELAQLRKARPSEFGLSRPRSYLSNCAQTAAGLSIMLLHYGEGVDAATDEHNPDMAVCKARRR